MDRYRENKVVGRGGYGEAVLCTRSSDDKACIIKKVNISMLPPEKRGEARKEAALLGNLSHPHIVGFWESFLHGSSQGVLCIVMEYAEGGDLGDYIKRARRNLLSEELILDWFVQMTLALEYIHGKKILHRALKPLNIFLTRSGEIKLGDFGIAKVLDRTYDMASKQTGTLLYMAPEIHYRKPYSHKADMWSLG